MLDSVHPPPPEYPLDADGRFIVTVDAGASHSVEYVIDDTQLEGSAVSIRWNFSTEANDIDFDVALRPPGETELRPLLPTQRHDASENAVTVCKSGRSNLVHYMPL